MQPSAGTLKLMLLEPGDVMGLWAGQTLDPTQVACGSCAAPFRHRHHRELAPGALDICVCPHEDAKLATTSD
jgi:hypothetical protein